MISVRESKKEFTLVQIRPMRVQDLEDVMQVEKSAYASPWSINDFYREITFNQLAFYFVALAQQDIAGFVGMWLVVDEAHITNIAVRTDYRGKGIGEQLLAHILKQAKSKGARRCILEVRVSNHKAQNLYLKHGFRYVGLRKNYYRDNGEDAFLMQKDLP